MKKIILITLWCFGGMAAKAQIPQPDPDTTARHFLIVASIGNLQEISAGQLAEQQAQRPDVKAFGKMMITDHQQTENTLMQLVKAKGYSLPEAVTGGIQPDLNLKNAGDHFDQLYVHGMVVAHSDTVETFKNYAVNGKDPIVKAFAQQMLPALKHHLEEIEKIDARIRDTAK